MQILAADYDNREAIFLLIEKGANVNSEDKEGQTPLMYVCATLHADLVRLLIQHHADVNHVGKAGWPHATALDITRYHVSLHSENVEAEEVIALLKQAGAKE